jgi:hypothetical protein
MAHLVLENHVVLVNELVQLLQRGCIMYGLHIASGWIQDHLALGRHKAMII